MKRLPMEEIIQETLGKGVEMHIAGEFDLADQLYASVIKLQPHHADANHNMGLLKADMGQDLEALPYLQIALQADTSIAQFWLSYIRALIKLDRVDEAARILNLATESGVQGEEFLELHQKLNELTSLVEVVKSQTARSNQPNPNPGSQSPSQGAINHLLNLYNQGQLSAAVEQARALVEQYPSAFIVWNILGAANKGMGQIDEAAEAFQKVTEINPNYADGFNNLGAALHDQGKLDEAIEAYKNALSFKPHDAETHYNMGVTLQEQGNLDKAVKAYQKAITFKPDYAEAFSNMGHALKDQGILEEAITAYKKALSIEPNNAEVYNKMGNALKEHEQLKEALEAYNKAIILKPDYADAHNNMGVALQEHGKLEDAIQAYKKALSITPDYAQAYNNMGNALREQGKLEEAIEAYNKALSFKPDYAQAYSNLGDALKEQGKLDKAIEAYNKALFLKPDYSEVHRSLSSLIKYEANDPQLATVVEIIQRSDLKENDRCHLYYALAKMNEDLGKFEDALKHYISGGALRTKLLSYDLKQDEVLFAQIKNTAPKLKELSLRNTTEALSQTPIFILGMPRSGTSLVEQIISSHFKVHGAGELLFLERFGGKLSCGVQDISSDNLIDVRNSYLDELGKVSDNKQFVTDKMPHNFLHIGLILKALPEAKIIHVKRNPAATCWSNFKHYFSTNELGYSYDLNDTVSYFKMYQDLMDFWDQQSGHQIYHLDYDRLTIDQEIETRKLIGHLDLEWDDACLSPQENKRSVRTASQQQVRKKVYKGSSEVWRKFEPYLDSIFEPLEG